MKVILMNPKPKDAHFLWYVDRNKILETKKSIKLTSMKSMEKNKHFQYFLDKLT